MIGPRGFVSAICYDKYKIRDRKAERSINILPVASRGKRLGDWQSNETKVLPQRAQRNTEGKGKRMEVNQVSGAVVDAAMKVHSELGPGLMESAYEGCLKHELLKRGLKCLSQVEMPLQYDGVEIDLGYKLDLLVEDVVIVELKAVERVLPVHEAQLLSYLKLSGKRVGLLINFNVPHLKNGIKRFVNG